MPNAKFQIINCSQELGIRHWAFGIGHSPFTPHYRPRKRLRAVPPLTVGTPLLRCPQYRTIVFPDTRGRVSLHLLSHCVPHRRGGNLPPVTAPHRRGRCPHRPAGGKLPPLHSPLSIVHWALGIRHSALGIRHWAFGIGHSFYPLASMWQNRFRKSLRLMLRTTHIGTASWAVISMGPSPRQMRSPTPRSQS